MYVMQYPGVSVTQASLNERLLEDLKGFNSINPKELDLKNSTLELVKSMDELNNEYKKFADQTSVSGDRLRENNFAEKKVRKGEIGPKVAALIDKYLAVYKTVGKKDLSKDLLEPEDFIGNKFHDFFI
jgi:hypothetical protein